MNIIFVRSSNFHFSLAILAGKKRVYFDANGSGRKWWEQKLDAFWSSMMRDLCVLNKNRTNNLSLHICDDSWRRLQTINISHCMLYHIYIRLSFITCIQIGFATVLRCLCFSSVNFKCSSQHFQRVLTALH